MYGEFTSRRHFLQNMYNKGCYTKLMQIVLNYYKNRSYFVFFIYKIDKMNISWLKHVAISSPIFILLFNQKEAVCFVHKNLSKWNVSSLFINFSANHKRCNNVSIISRFVLTLNVVLNVNMIWMKWNVASWRACKLIFVWCS